MALEKTKDYDGEQRYSGVIKVSRWVLNEDPEENRGETDQWDEWQDTGVYIGPYDPEKDKDCPAGNAPKKAKIQFGIGDSVFAMTPAGAMALANALKDIALEAQQGIDECGAITYLDHKGQMHTIRGVQAYRSYWKNGDQYGMGTIKEGANTSLIPDRVEKEEDE